MKQIFDSCKELGIDPPDEVEEFFPQGEPSEKGIEVDQDSLGDAVKEWEEDWGAGIDIEIALLPKNITHIRVH